MVSATLCPAQGTLDAEVKSATPSAKARRATSVRFSLGYPRLRNGKFL